MVRAHAVILAVLLATPAYAQGSGGGQAGSAASGGASRLSPDVGGGQSPGQAARDSQPGHLRASPLAHSTPNPDVPGAAASDSTAGTSSQRSPEPKPGN